MNHTIGTKEPYFWIKPKDIDVEYLGRNNSSPVTEFARCLVMFCRNKGDWTPFLFQEINKFYDTFFSTNKNKLFRSELLVSEGLIQEKDQKIFVTKEFIERCRTGKI